MIHLPVNVIQENFATCHTCAFMNQSTHACRESGQNFQGHAISNECPRKLFGKKKIIIAQTMPVEGKPCSGCGGEDSVSKRKAIIL